MKTSAKDILNPDVISINENTVLRKALQLLNDNNISGLPVLDNKDSLVGILTESDIIEYCRKTHVISLLDTSGWISPHENICEKHSYKLGTELLDGTKVKTIMSKRLITAHLSTPIIDIAKIMRRRKINRILVTDKNKKLYGIIARADIINHLATINT